MGRNSIEPSLTNGTTEVVCADVRRWIDAAARSGDPTPPSQVLSTHVERCAICQGALLLLIAAGAELPPPTSRPLYQQCLDDLPAYIEQELEAVSSAIRAYPHVWWHLLICRDCAEVYRLTHAMIEAERDGQLAPVPQLRRITLRNVLRLTRDIINRALIPSPMFGMAPRGGLRRPIVLAEEDNAQGYAITLSIEPQPDGACRVLIRAVPPPVGDMLLTLGDATFRTAFDAHGVAVVAGVPTPLLVDPDGPDLVVGIDLDPSP
jgi:hypothetical protein